MALYLVYHTSISVLVSALLSLVLANIQHPGICNHTLLNSEAAHENEPRPVVVTVGR